MKKGPKGNNISGLHVGLMVRKRMFAAGINKARLARKLNRGGATLKRSLMASTMQAYLIWELSVALKHNFFADLAAQVDAATEGSLQEGKVTIEALQAELKQLREERDILMRVVEKMSR